MSAAKDSSAKAPSDGVIVSTRVFDAPRELLFKAWTDPDHLVRWWGPQGFTNTFLTALRHIWPKWPDACAGDA